MTAITSLGVDPLDVEMTLRMLLAFMLGALLGWERERAGRPAGLRTFMMVTAGSAAFTLVSIYGFAGLGTVRDPARVAAQIVTGIGFLGAGTIWRTTSTVRGLTTAAGIWFAAAVGMMAGAGMYLIAVVTATLGFICLQWLRSPARRAKIAGEPSMVGEPSTYGGHPPE
ncbi:MAG TPA: MgtC/SapB family protein [Acetobacteraceae bacterium]|jgi:putative Mg2+ transporter-C (MgtC) family protein|nr:MgtC/SapB family protein [Acetobacteraceae bacterium]